MNSNSNTEHSIIISNFKEMYESNNRVLTSITMMNNNNINNDNVNNLISNLINSNNEIMRNINLLINYNNILNTNNRQQNSVRHNNNNNNNNNRQNSNRQHSNSRHNNNNETSLPNFIYRFLEPIEIFPTQTQIEIATRVARFGDIVTPLNNSCPITLENFNENDQVLVIRHCSHIFSRSGLSSWFRSNCRCPVCRYDIRNYASNNTHVSSVNVDSSSNILPVSLQNVERRNRNNPTSILVDLLLNDFVDVPNASSNTNSVSDISGNLLHFFFTP